MDNEVKDVFAKVRYSAEAEYKDIVYRHSKGVEHPIDAARLRELVKELGITLHQALHDSQTLKRARELWAIARHKEARYEVSAKASAELSVAEKEVAAKIKVLQESLVPLRIRAHVSKEEHMESVEANGAYNRLRESCPKLFEGVADDDLQ